MTEITKHCITCGNDGHTYIECPADPFAGIVARAFGAPDLIGAPARFKLKDPPWQFVDGSHSSGNRPIGRITEAKEVDGALVITAKFDSPEAKAMALSAGWYFEADEGGAISIVDGGPGTPLPAGIMSVGKRGKP